MIIKCNYCGKDCDFEVGKINRAKKVGLNLFCNRTCAGLGRRKNYTAEEKKRLKADYDRLYRGQNAERLKAEKAAYYKTPAGRAAQKRNREKMKDNHRKYIRSERYRKWKHDYDQKYHAQKNFGEFWESSLILKDVEKLIEPEKYETKLKNGLLNKSQNRKRLWNSMQKI